MSNTEYFCKWLDVGYLLSYNVYSADEASFTKKVSLLQTSQFLLPVSFFCYFSLLFCSVILFIVLNNPPLPVYKESH